MIGARHAAQVDAEQAGEKAGGQKHQRHDRHLVGALVGGFGHQVIDLVRQHGGAGQAGVEIVQPAAQPVGNVEQAAAIVVVEPADFFTGQPGDQIPLGER